ncbi:HAD-IA family hydrolase [Glaciecola sp. MH2013]|uniref:HAD-IA family hydrolase n=1 Tax=Glaciecola sp. MH2013 TaxID=2785524 RepID=UPI0018A0EE43|nr:HAD-IA family hydrolase [Glaciecola sp. MH2013]MBF7072920.1 HAD-IA family hydrolase [Glaciecola sp. MH2013]
MEHEFKYIIFDWDGTVMDSAAKIVACMQRAAILSGLPKPSKKEVENIIGISLKPAIQILFSIDSIKADEVTTHYKETFLNEDTTACPLFPHAESTLLALQQKARLAVATGKARRGLDRAFSLTNTKHFFELSRCADEAESKPSSDMLLQILAQWQVSAEEVLMVGDTTYDMQMAENIGMPRVAVSYGVHDAQDLQKHSPLKLIDCFSELLDFV